MEGGGRREEGRQGKADGRKQEANILTSSVWSRHQSQKKTEAFALTVDASLTFDLTLDSVTANVWAASLLPRIHCVSVHYKLKADY